MELLEQKEVIRLGLVKLELEALGRFKDLINMDCENRVVLEEFLNDLSKICKKLDSNIKSEECGIETTNSRSDFEKKINHGSRDLISVNGLLKMDYKETRNAILEVGGVGNMFSHVYYSIPSSIEDGIIDMMVEYSFVSCITYTADTGDRELELSILTESMNPSTMEVRKKYKRKESMVSGLIRIGAITEREGQNILLLDIDNVTLYITD
jgi:hypothetical protein